MIVQKRTLFGLIFFATAILFSGCAHHKVQRMATDTTSAALEPVALQCEYRTNPLGIDEKQPRLSWQFRSVARGQMQTAYQIIVASSAERLEPDRADMWNSGKVMSTENIHIPYNGKPLQSRQRYFWQVRVWDKDGSGSTWSSPAWWEMALLSPDEWTAKWIDDGKPVPERDEDFYKDDPAPLFRKEFAVGKGVKRARLYITGLGYYEAYLNGAKVGEQVLDPGWTTYGRRVLYSTFDVTDQIRQGANCIGVWLGNGWYNPLPMRMWGKFNLRDALTVGRPRFIAQLEIEYADGTLQKVVSDESWQAGQSPILRNSVYLGEMYDARREQPGWSSPGFSDNHWRQARIAAEKLGVLQAQSQPPIRVTKIIKPVNITQPRPGVFIFDMGQNFAGWARLHVKGPAGTTVKLRYGELLYPDGTLNAMTTVAGQIKKPGRGGPGAPDTAWQCDTYILKGQGKEVYTPRFTFHGFRYVEVTGYPGRPTLDALQGLRLNADVTSAGSFSCSDSLFNRIYRMSRWTFLSNLFSVQSDCPHREKFGYGGDIVPTCTAFMLNFDMTAFYAKVVRDFADAVRPNGGLTETAPYVGIADMGFGGGSGPIGWGFAHPLLQKELYRFYGNRRLVEEQYDVARRWVDFLSEHARDHIIDVGISDHESLDPKPTALTGTAFYYAAAKLVADLAGIIGRNDDADRYAKLTREIKEAFVRRFLKPGSGRFDIGTQACQAFALYFDLVPARERQAAISVLLDEILNRHDGHLATGIFGTRYMLDVLTETGHSDVAYTVAAQKTFPGWGYMLQNGATTLWEHWAFSDNVYSHNHPMFGSIVGWFYSAIAGIRPAADAVGFDRVIIKPEPVKALTWARASYQSVRGRVASEWRKENGRFVLNAEIPVNTVARIYLPTSNAAAITESGISVNDSKDVVFLGMEDNRAVFRVGSGRYVFRSPLD